MNLEGKTIENTCGDWKISTNERDQPPCLLVFVFVSFGKLLLRGTSPFVAKRPVFRSKKLCFLVENFVLAGTTEASEWKRRSRGNLRQRSCWVKSPGCKIDRALIQRIKNYLQGWCKIWNQHHKFSCFDKKRARRSRLQSVTFPRLLHTAHLFSRESPKFTSRYGIINHRADSRRSHDFCFVIIALD